MGCSFVSAYQMFPIWPSASLDQESLCALMGEVYLNHFAYGACPFLPLPLEPGGASARVSLGDGPPSHEKEKQVCGFSS